MKGFPMSHPPEPLNDRELHNFGVFLRANPHLTRPAPQAAFDAMPKNIRRVPGKQIRTPLKDFRKGGKFDTARYAMDEADPDDVVSPGEAGMAFLRDLAMKLSPEGWAALREACMEGQEGAEDEPPEFEGKPDVGKGPPAMDSAAAKSFAERYPDIAGVRVNTIGQQPRSEPSRLTAKGAASFNAMFPEAARIKVR
jgi:hypothetical protein